MRILFMSDTPADPDSGAAGTELRTIAALRALGHEVDALWSDALGRRISHGNLHYLLELPRAYGDAMRRQLAHAAYDVVHASQPHGYLAAREARARGVSPVFVHRSHGFEPRVAAAMKRWQPFEKCRSPARRIASAALAALLEINYRGIARYAHGHIVSSSLCADTLREYGVPRTRIAVIPQAPPESFRAPAPAFDAARVDRLLHVGQFAFVKGPHVLARAFEAVLRKRPNATLTYVCSAAHHNRARELFDAQTRHRVTFVDWMPQHELSAIYDSHGVFLFPSLFEGFGKALVEAMARGLAVVASDEGAAHDFLINGENGLRVPVGDADAMAQACLRLAADPARAARMGELARQTALACTWQRTASETADFYRRLIGMQ
jgi:glycosyltransferase involved in cell wall biosynthesis